jgi:hypothetical protein
VYFNPALPASALEDFERSTHEIRVIHAATKLKIEFHTRRFALANHTQTCHHECWVIEVRCDEKRLDALRARLEEVMARDREIADAVA